MTLCCSPSERYTRDLILYFLPSSHFFNRVFKKHSWKEKEIEALADLESRGKINDWYKSCVGNKQLAFRQQVW